MAKGHWDARSQRLVSLKTSNPRSEYDELPRGLPAFAVELAAKHGLWEYKLTEPQQAAYEAYRRKIALAYIAEQQGQPVTNGHDTSTEETSNG